MSLVKITAADVKKLRDMTGAGMSDCKTALQEAEGDFEAAIENLRKKGQKMTEKRADRDAKDGVVLALTNGDNNKGIVVRISCETDFVAKNQDFVSFVQSIADLALQEFPETKEALLSLQLDGLSVSDRLVEKTGVIGEKVELAGYGRIEAAYVSSYIHTGNKAGVIAGFNKANANSEEVGKNIAMQIAAMNPIALNEEQIDEATVNKEIEIAKELARNEGKPEELLERIAQGKLKTFYKENTLLNQEYVKNPKQTVAAYLNSVEKGLTVTDFKHIALG